MATNLKDYNKADYKVRGRVVEVPYLYIKKKKHTTKGYQFLGRFSIQGKLFQKVLGYSDKDGLTVKRAGELIHEYKREIEEGYKPTGVTSLDKLSSLYFDSVADSDWNRVKKSIYNRYIQKALGAKRIENIREMDIKRIIKQMEEKGLSPRTKKSILEVLKPMFSFATRNKILRDNPTLNINVTIPSQKKVVTNATELFKRVYVGINAYYHDNPYYRGLFLFGFTGRRKGEILNLKWENIDFINNYYWIEDTKNNDKQKYELPTYLVEALEAIKDDHVGLVFKSPVTGKKIVNIDRQMRQLKKFIGLDVLSLHYMRNILVSSLAEQGTEAITLSGILGHKDANTINKYLSLNHFKSSQIGLNKVDEILDVEIL